LGFWGFGVLGFWEYVEQHSAEPGVNSIGFFEGERLHPACLFVKRILLNQTKKNFGIVPDVSDHFSRLTQDIKNINEQTTGITQILPDALYLHMAGLSHNMRLIAEGDKPNHHVEEFNNYVRDCLEVTVPLPENLLQLFHSYLSSL
jgi:hypothetical protein